MDQNERTDKTAWYLSQFYTRAILIITLSPPFPEQVILPYNNSKTKREFGDDEVYGPFSIPYGFLLNGQPFVAYFVSGRSQHIHVWEIAYFVSIRSQHMHVLRNFLLGKYQITTHARLRNCLLCK